MAEKKSWLKIIGRLKRLINEVGGLWQGTSLSGYEEHGPYHCEDCSFLKGQKAGEIFRDVDGKGRCNHPAVIADPKVEKDQKTGLGIVHIERGCCAFVDQPKEHKGKESEV